MKTPGLQLLGDTLSKTHQLQADRLAKVRASRTSRLRLFTRVMKLYKNEFYEMDYTDSLELLPLKYINQSISFQDVFILI